MPYWRLSSIYFCYFAVVGSISPYWGLYLQSLGFGIKDIGFIVSIPLFTKLISPNVWGWLADKTQKPIQVMLVGSVGTCLFFLVLIVRIDYWSLVAFVTLYSFFWNAILPQFEVVTLRYLSSNPHVYSRIRVWGSLGFIALVLLLGVAFEYLSLNVLPNIVLFFMISILFLIVSLPLLPEQSRLIKPQKFIEILTQPLVLMFFFVLFLLQFSHGVYYAFFSIYLDQLEYSTTAIATFWTLGVLAEIVFFLKVPLLLRRYDLYTLLLVTLLLTSLRWFLLAFFADNVLILAGSQLLHAFSFGAAHTVAIEFVRNTFGRDNQSQGQAFYSAASFGGGTALGIFVSSQVWESSEVFAFAISVVAAFLAAILCFLFLKPILTQGV